MLIYLFSYRIKKFRDPLDQGDPLNKVKKNEFPIIMNIACKVSGTNSISLYDSFLPEEKRKLAAEEIGFFVEHMDKLTKYDNQSLIYAAEAIPYIIDLEPEPQNNCSNIMAFFSCICCCCGNKKKGADVAYDEKAEKLLGS